MGRPGRRTRRAVRVEGLRELSGSGALEVTGPFASRPPVPQSPGRLGPCGGVRAALAVCVWQMRTQTAVLAVPARPRLGSSQSAGLSLCLAPPSAAGRVQTWDAAPGDLAAAWAGPPGGGACGLALHRVVAQVLALAGPAPPRSRGVGTGGHGGRGSLVFCSRPRVFLTLASGLCFAWDLPLLCHLLSTFNIGGTGWVPGGEKGPPRLAGL